MGECREGQVDVRRTGREGGRRGRRKGRRERHERGPPGVIRRVQIHTARDQVTDRCHVTGTCGEHEGAAAQGVAGLETRVCSHQGRDRGHVSAPAVGGYASVLHVGWIGYTRVLVAAHACLLAFVAQWLLTCPLWLRARVSTRTSGCTRASTSRHVPLPDSPATYSWYSHPYQPEGRVVVTTYDYYTTSYPTSFPVPSSALSPSSSLASTWWQHTRRQYQALGSSIPDVSTKHGP
eukprot:2956768-Rhodomonas_salina.1